MDLPMVGPNQHVLMGSVRNATLPFESAHPASKSMRLRRLLEYFVQWQDEGSKEAKV